MHEEAPLQVLDVAGPAGRLDGAHPGAEPATVQRHPAQVRRGGVQVSAPRVPQQDHLRERDHSIKVQAQRQDRHLLGHVWPGPVPECPVSPAARSGRRE